VKVESERRWTEGRVKEKVEVERRYIEGGGLYLHLLYLLSTSTFSYRVGGGGEQGGICRGEGGDFPCHCFMTSPALVGR